MKQGRIIKIISNQYTLHDGQKEYLARPLGKMRLSQSPVVGDLVDFDDSQDTVTINQIQPRKNRLLRPAVANVDQALIVTSCKDPDFSEHLLNRLIFLVLLAGVQPVICITKYDLASEEEKEKIEEVLNWYRKSGYTVLYSYPNSDQKELREVLDGKISVLCGQSGAGKSSLLNRLDPTFQLFTQEISKALGRGKHSTRHCQLHETAGGYVADTPGFSSLDFSRIDLDHLDQVIPDFKPYLNSCRFADCRHLAEPDCAIKEALENGKINPVLYEDYKYLLTQTPRGKKY